MPTKIKTIMGVAEFDMGGAIHTAFRKFDGSERTALAYNIITLADKGWSDYLKLAWAGMVALKPKSKTDVMHILKDAAEKLESGEADANCLKLVFRLFTEDDWMTAMGFFEEK